MKKISILILISCLYILPLSYAQSIIPSDKLIQLEHLKDYLKKDVKEKISKKTSLSEASLAQYFRQKFSERFFYDWKNFPSKFKTYNAIYNKQSYHRLRAEDHMQKYNATTQWQLPFDYLNGEEVNAYALRHLARQHKMVDIAYQYFYEEKDPKYIQYFIQQVKSLNTALENGKYDKIEDGNGVYEVFRSGYRILNWLSIHQMFLGESEYNDTAQLTSIATLLQHGAHLYERNTQFRSGNHQTRGMSALAMLAILLRDFEGTDKWYQRAMERLEEHLSKEINNDGFQFERSVHYHISDIENYFYVYRLAQINQIEVNEDWTNKLESLFITLTKIAYPDKSAPVLQDDTNKPWAEKNDISGAMTLGYLLFNDPSFGYFSDIHVEDKMYWFLQEQQLQQLKSITKEKPSHGSLLFPDTHYYIMREGWNQNDKMMIISAGLDAEKPDHQHGDMLGIQAMANGQVILPNYQVRYSLTDYGFFKNSLVKNVALVDTILQGKKYTSNKGGSGFGKFKKLPQPKTITWKTNALFDFYAGSHNGFEQIDVSYSRQVLFLKDDFWIIKDNFSSNDTHTYKQVWQGHYTNDEQPNLLRATFSNGSGCDIYQLQPVEQTINDGKRGKEWSIVSSKNQQSFQFITVIYPFSSYSKRIDESSQKATNINEWQINQLPFEAKGAALQSLSSNKNHCLFNVTQFTLGGNQITFSTATDIVIQDKGDSILVHSIGTKAVDIQTEGKHSLFLEGKDIQQEGGLFKPESILVLRK